jgi:hypothetical protein
MNQEFSNLIIIFSIFVKDLKHSMGFEPFRWEIYI